MPHPSVKHTSFGLEMSLERAAAQTTQSAQCTTSRLCQTIHCMIEFALPEIKDDHKSSLYLCSPTESLTHLRSNSTYSIHNPQQIESEFEFLQLAHRKHSVT